MKLNKILQFTIKTNSIYFILFIIAISLSASAFTLLLPANFDKNPVAALLKTTTDKVLMGIIFLPLVETYIFQTFIISAVRWFIKRPQHNFYPAILLSGIIFAVNHPYNIFYMIGTFILGIIWAFAYYISRYRKMNATLTVFIIHAIWNSIAFLTN